MPTIADVLTNNLDVWTSAIERKSTAGRGRSKKFSLYGIEKLRALILDLAVRGKLVPQDPNDEPVSDVLKRLGVNQQQRALSTSPNVKRPETPNSLPFSLPKSWSWSRLGIVTNYGQTEKANPGEVDADTWVLELEDVEKGSSRLIQKVRYGERPFQSQKNRFQLNDVIYGKLRPYLDKVLIADEAGVCTTEMVPMRGFSGLAPSYLRIYLKSPYFIDLATNSTHGMNLPRLGTEKARDAPFALPPFAEQHRIVAKVDELMTLCDALEAGTYETIEAHELLVENLLATLTDSDSAEALAESWARIETHFDTLFITEASIDQLKQTMIQLAVMGKLVAQDPKDEPASELSRKMAADRANAHSHCLP
jgi:type I restriction enzyme, S subunit